MQGPIVDLVLLLLLILFFGLQQRRRPQVYFRFWFVGWIFVFLSYVAWFMQARLTNFEPLQNAVCFNFLLLGVFTFLMSLLAKEHGTRKIILCGLAMAAASMVIVDTQQFIVIPPLVLAGGVLVAEGIGFTVAFLLIPKRWPRRRYGILTICMVYGSALTVYAWRTPASNLDHCVIVEVLLCAAVMYAGSAGRRGVSGWAGTVGFASWAGFYLLKMHLGESGVADHGAGRVLEFPKVLRRLLDDPQGV